MEGGGEVSDTPRTDKVEKFFFGDNRPSMEIECVKSAFAKTLERENTALRAHAERLAEALEKCKENAREILEIRWGWDGDCGADTFANSIEDQAEEALTLYRAENPKV